MNNQAKTNTELMEEISILKQRIEELERSESEYKREEEVLREREIQLWKLASWVPGMIYRFVKRPDGTLCVPFTTEAIKDIFGCSPQDVRDDFSPIANVILGEDLDKVVGSIEYSARHLTAWSCEYRVQIPGQPVRWMLGNSTPEKLPDGSVTWYGFNTDITDRKRSEEALRRSERNFHRFIDESPLGVRIVTAAGETIYANQAILDIYGFDSVEEFEKTPTKKRYTPESYAEFLTRREKRREGVDTPSEYTIAIIRKDGEVRYLQVCRKRILWDGERQFQVIYRDITEHQRAEEALRESEAKYRFLTDYMRDIVWTVNLDLKTTYVSPSIARVLGFTPEEWMQKDVQAQMTPESYAAVMERYAEEMGKERIGADDPDRSLLMEIEYRHKDGHSVWLESSLRAIRDHAGRLTGVHGVSRDTTDRRRVEQALKESEECYRSLFENSQDAVLLTVPDGSILDANPAACSIFGRTVDEIRKAGRNGLVDATDPRLTDALQERARAGRTRSELAMLRRGGEKFPAEVSSTIFINAHGQQRSSMIIRDLTESKLAEEKLKKAKQDWETIIQGIGHPAIVLDPGRGIIAANLAVFKATGVAESEMLGRPCYEIFHPGRQAPPDGCPMEKLLAGGTAKDVEMDIEALNGIFHVHCTPVLDGAGNLEKIIHVMTDITESKKAESVLRESEEMMRYIVKHDPNAVAVYDRNLHYIAVSDRYLHDYDVQEKDIIGRHHYEVFPEMPQRWKDVHQRCLAGAIERNDDDYFERPDGSITYNRWECRPWRRATGDIGGIITYTEVTTERKLAAEALRKSYDYLADLHNSLADVVFTVKMPEREIRFVNNAVETVFGYRVSECVGQSTKILYPDAESYADLGRKLEEGIEEGRSVLHLQHNMARKNGEIFPIEITLTFRKEKAQVLEVIGVVKDITERKQSENALREKQERLEAAYRLAHMGVWNWDRETKALTWSDELYRLFGWDPRLPPPDISEHRRIYAPGYWDCQREANERALQTGASRQLELEHIHTDGTRRWITSVVGPLYDASGRIKGLQGTVQDITDQKQAQERQRKEREWKNLLFWLYEEAPKYTDKEVFDYALERIVELTASKIGFLHLVSNDQKSIILTAWNQTARENCTASHDNHYPMEQAGNWVDCVRVRKPVIYNDFPHSPNQKGLPPGHAPITRFMSIPVMEAARVRVIFGVGNKDAPYDMFDLTQIQLMANDLQSIITRRRAEEALRVSEKRYREMMELLPVTVFETDTSGRILSFNPAALQTFGLPNGAAKKDLNIFEFVSEKDKEMAKAHFTSAIRGRLPKLREYEASRADGSVFPAMVLSHHIIKDGNIIGLRGVVIDMTEIKTVQEAYRISEEKYRSIYENAMEGIFQVTVDGRFISANPALARMHGYETPEEMMAKVTDIGHQYYVDPSMRGVYLNIMSRKGSVSGFEFEAYRRDGGRIWASVNAREVRDDNGQVLYHEGTTEDITKRKEAEEELREAYLVLQETHEQLIQADKLAAVGTLAAGVAHEILNPMNIIGVGIAALETTQDLPVPVKEAFAVFQRQIDRVVRIARDLQQFSRKSVKEMKVTDLRKLMQDTLALSEPRLKVERLHLSMECDVSLPEIHVDRQRMEQVFLNIINNAIDAMAETETKELRIEIKNLRDGECKVKGILIVFSDRGQGIRKEDLDRLFDPFFTTKTVGHGTGLGLSISHSIVQNHGGRIWAENNPEGGAIFYIELPLAIGQDQKK